MSQINNAVPLSSTMFAYLKPVISINRLMFTLPIRTRINGLDRCLVWSKLYTVLNFIGLIVIAFSVIHGSIVILEDQEDDKYKLKTMPGKFMTYINIFQIETAFILTTLTSNMKFHYFCEYLRCLYKVDVILEYNLTENEIKTNKLTMFLITSIALLAFLSNIFLWACCSTKSIFDYITVFLPYRYMHVFQYFIAMSFYCTIHLLNLRIKYLRTILNDKYFNNVDNEIIRKRHQSIRKYDGRTFSRRICPSEENFDHIDYAVQQKTDIVKIYGLLFEAGCAINQYYGFIILQTLLGCLIHLMQHIYLLFTDMIENGLIYYLSLRVFWIFIHITKLLIVVEPCHVTTQEIKQLSELVFKLRSMDIKDRWYQLEIFGSQLVHCPIQFSAFDLIGINRPLITSIATGVTTYLVILFQFNTTEETT